MGRRFYFEADLKGVCCYLISFEEAEPFFAFIEFQK